MASSTIISRLSTHFTNGQGSGTSSGSRTIPDVFTRDIGGHFRLNQPYISGYFHIMVGLPQKLFGGSEFAKTASRWLHSTCEGFTPHSQSITKVDVMGLGQTGSSFAANVMTTREFTLTFREYQNMPIMNVIRAWSAVFDPFTGVSPLTGNEFIPPNYKGWIAVAQTKPVRSDGNALAEGDIEECFIYQGVFPTSVPVDTASASDITGNDTVQLSVTFSFDGHPMSSNEPGITSQVIKLFNSINPLSGGTDGSTYETHLNNALKVEQWTGVASDSSLSTNAKVDS